MRKFIWKPFKNAIVKVYANDDLSVKYGKTLAVFEEVVNKEKREVVYVKELDYIPKLIDINFFFGENKVKIIK